MIKFRGEHEGQPLLGFGLSRRNVQKLKEGKPIFVNLKEMGIEGRICIFYGDTEKAMLRELEKAGLLDPPLRLHYENR